MESATSTPGGKFRQANDASFSSSISEGYEKALVPLLFEPYARDLSSRVASYEPMLVLELAAGTGAVTRELALALPGTEIVATDLNQTMLDVAARIVQSRNVRFQQADACALPFDARSFDVVLAQFGVMFFPDKVTAFREARRTLRDDGALIFNVWDGLTDNPLDDLISDIYRAKTGEACFLERVPFAYCDCERIAADLRHAGFSDVSIVTVKHTTTAPSAVAAFDALVGGSPLGGDFERLGTEQATTVRQAIVDELGAVFGTSEFTNDMSALVVTAPV